MPRLRWKRKNLCFAVKCLPSLVYNANVKILQHFLLKTMWAQQMQGTENSQYSIYQHASDISVTFEFCLWKSKNIKKERWEIEHLLPFIWDSFSQKTLSLLVIVVSPTKTYSLLHFLGYKTFWRKVYKSPTMKMKIFFVGCDLFSSEIKEEMVSIVAAVENRSAQKIPNQSSPRNCCGSRQRSLSDH